MSQLKVVVFFFYVSVCFLEAQRLHVVCDVTEASVELLGAGHQGVAVTPAGRQGPWARHRYSLYTHLCSPWPLTSQKVQIWQQERQTICVWSLRQHLQNRDQNKRSLSTICDVTTELGYSSESEVMIMQDMHDGVACGVLQDYWHIVLDSLLSWQHTLWVGLPSRSGCAWCVQSCRLESRLPWCRCSRGNSQTPPRPCLGWTHAFLERGIESSRI